MNFAADSTHDEEVKTDLQIVRRGNHSMSLGETQIENLPGLNHRAHQIETDRLCAEAAVVSRVAW